MDIAGSMNITFKADIAALRRPPAVGAVLGDPAGLQRRRHRRRPGADGPAVERVADRLGLRHQRRAARWSTRRRRPRSCATCSACPTSTCEITGTSLWGNNEMYATHLQSGRVFCAGDAVHRHPPSNGLGSNTSIQDSYNLAWKLAAVLRGQAAPALLDTYSAERAPVAKQIVHAGQQVQPRVRPVLRGARA